MPQSPNILWICTDQQRFDTLGCYGNDFVKTPNLDRLAEMGVLFEYAFCQSPVCTPSRASFLTGRYPRTTRCRQNGQSIPDDEMLVTRILAEAGYTCGLSGKLHLSACNPQAAPIQERRINDGYAEFHWSHTPMPSSAVPHKVPGDGYAQFHWSHDTNNQWPTNEYFRWLREQRINYERVAFQGSEHVQTSVKAEHHQTTWCIDKAISFIETNAAFNHPWLFSINMFDPHHPFDPPEEYLQPYLARLNEIDLPNFEPGELDNKPPFQATDHHQAYNNPKLHSGANMTDDDHRLVRAAYWAMVDLIDVQVGRLLDTLAETGQLENTIIIFMSDHGEMLGDHGIYLKGPYFYEPAIRVPLIIAGPGISPNRRSQALVELTDLAPMLLEAAGVEAYRGMQGQSLWPLLQENADLHQHREDIYCEYYNAMPWHKTPSQTHKTPSQTHEDRGHTPSSAQLTMVRTDRYKLVAAHGIDSGELYDLVVDPTETRNLWDAVDHQAVKVAMLKRLCDRMAWTVDPLPEREAPW